MRMSWRRSVGAGRTRMDEPRATPDSNGAAPYYIDTDGDARVELIAHARAAALENLPETDALEPTDAEGAVIREHQRRHRDLLERSRAEVGNLTGEFEQLEQQLPEPRDLESTVREGEAAIEKELATDTALGQQWQELQRRRRDLRSFNRENHTTEPARYPASLLFHVGVVALLVVLESLLNAGFFAASSSFGFVGGFLVAVGIAIGNVGLGLLGGYIARWRNHRRLRLRRLATAAVAGIAMVVVLFNLGVAHLREQGVAGQSGAPPVTSLFHDPLAISFPSAALFVVGLLAAAIAARKGFRLDSRIPGHGEVDRALRAAELSATEHDRALRQNILDHADRVPSRCRDIAQQAESIVRQLGELVVKAAKVLESYEAERERIERWCHQWLKRYRAENEAIRSTPSPAYFADFPPFTSQLDPGPVDRLRARMTTAQERLEQLRVAVGRTVAEHPARVTRAKERFERFRRETLRRADAGRGDGSAPDRALPELKELAS